MTVFPLRPSLLTRLVRAVLLVCVLLGATGFTGSMFGQAAILLSGAVDDGRLVTLGGNTHPLVKASHDLGAVEGSRPMDHVLLVLKRSAAQDKALAAAIAAMNQPGSSTYHKWLTPDQIGAKYGVAPSDVSTVVSWLGSKGLHVNSVSKAQSTIDFSGTAATISAAFHTEIHSYTWQGGTYTANARDLQVPAALTAVVSGVASLNNFPSSPLHTQPRVVQYDTQKKTWNLKPVSTTTGTPLSTLGKIKPDFTTISGTGTLYPLAPADFVKIYDVQPLYDKGADGTGQAIAIVAQSDIMTSDVDSFRASFGLPAKKLNIIQVGTTDPGYTDEGNAVEATLDVEWAGAIAPGATIDFVTAASTDSTPGYALAAAYAVDNQTAPVLNVSYGECELGLGNSGNLYFYQMWQQAAAEGITVVTASGDSGAATCDAQTSYGASYGDAVSGVASTPYTVSVGGTDFEVSVTNPTAYWSPTSDPKTLESALSYVPEAPWNQSCASPEILGVYGQGLGVTDNYALCNDPIGYLNGGSALNGVGGGGGGASQCAYLDDAQNCTGGYPKPDWQQGVNGIPLDNVRDVPDVSFFASDLTYNSGYLFCVQQLAGTCNFSDPSAVEYLMAGGTSFGAPVFAGIMALINQTAQSPQGFANYLLYKTGSQEYGSTASPNTAQTAVCNASSVPASGSGCVFHDITVGNNAQPCEPGTPDCVMSPTYPNGFGILPGFNSNAGYDLVTGLGSVDAANLAQQYESITRSQPAVTLAASPVTSTFGQPVTLSGTVSLANSSETPVGTVVVLGDGQGQGSAVIANGQYSQQVPTLLAGAYNLQASYLGSTSAQPVLSAPVAVTVNKASTAEQLSFTSLDVLTGAPLSPNGGSVQYGTMVQVTLNVAPASTVASVPQAGGVATFTLNGAATPPLTVAAGTVSTETFAGAVGSYPVTATYSGDSNYTAGAPPNAQYTIVPATTVLTAIPSTTALSSSSGTFNVTSTFSSSSHGAPPTGSVTFYLNGVSVGSAPVAPNLEPLTQAQGGITSPLAVQASQLNVGTNILTATYSGDANYANSTSAQSSISYQPNGFTSGIVLTASSTTLDPQHAVTLKASVTNSGNPATVGIVTFLDGTKQLGQVPVVGVASGVNANTGTATLVTLLPLGTHSITAVYGGTNGVLPNATSTAVSISVTGLLFTTTTISAAANSTTPANYDLTASLFSGGATPPTGNVEFDEPSANASLGMVGLSGVTPVVGFAPMTRYDVGIGGVPQKVIVGDFNGDGIPDMATTVQGAANTQLMVFLGKGNGTFGPGVSSVFTLDPNNPSATDPVDLVVGDFNADGKLDLAIDSFNGGTVAILLGNGDGTFARGQTVSVVGTNGSARASGLAVADLTGDGIEDLVVMNSSYDANAYNIYSGVLVFPGNGDGTFAAHLPVQELDFSNGMILQDLNGDGKPDVLVALEYDSESGFEIAYGNGDGTFAPPVITVTPGDPISDNVSALAVGDVDGDGLPDIVASIVSQNQVYFYHNGGVQNGAAPVFSIRGSFQDPNGAYGIALGDLNGDGKLDLVDVNEFNNTLTIAYGNGGGGFAQPVLYNADALPAGIILVDMDNDGQLDLVFLNEQAGNVAVGLNGVTLTTTLSNVAVIGPLTSPETVTAGYQGDTTHAASTSAPVTVHGSGGEPTFTSAASPDSLTITAGQTGTTQITLTPLYSFTGTATLACGAMPAGVTCAFSPGSLALSGTPAISTLTVTTLAPLASALLKSAPFQASVSFPVTWGGGAVVAMASMLMLGFFGRRRRALNLCLTLVVATGFLFASVGCGNSGKTSSTSVGPVADTLKLSSSAIKSASGSTVTITAVSSSNTATGTVTFYEGATVLGTGTLQSGAAKLALTSLTVGTHAVTAQYAGDTNNSAATAGAIDQVITGTTTFNVTATSGSLSQTSTITLVLQ